MVSTANMKLLTPTRKDYLKKFMLTGVSYVQQKILKSSYLEVHFMKYIVTKLRILGILLLIFLLTLITQVGGIAFVISLTVSWVLNKRVNNVWKRLGIRLGSFVVIYLLFVFAIAPLIAKPLGRVPLPLFEHNHVRPVNAITFLLNRNYVRPEMRRIVYVVAEQMNEKHPGTTLNYLDANFPFIDKFPLFPHLSHSDGKKLDLSFLYKDSETEMETNEVPSWIGYGICEEPKPGEENRPEYCEKKGYWQYSALKENLSQESKKDFIFDEARTKFMINSFVKEKNLGKILIEPHLKSRLQLTSKKIRLHGCNAVRHDDHIHVQLQ
jgi:hypothetical protein